MIVRLFATLFVSSMIVVVVLVVPWAVANASWLIVLTSALMIVGLIVTGRRS